MVDTISQTFTAKQAAEYLGTSYWSLLSLAKQGNVKHYRVGNRILFRQKSLDNWIDEQEENSINNIK